MEKRQALGKGLSALIPDLPGALAPARAPAEVDVDLLEPNAYQPRGEMADDALDRLAASIRSNGVIQPVVVRRIEGGRYEIIAGERRWRAAQRAGLLKVPVLIKEVESTDRQRMLAMALVENIQRQDLNAIEEAAAYRRLIEEFGMRQEDVAEQVGKDRSTVANHLRLLKLPDEVQRELASGRLSMGHARAIAGLGPASEQVRLTRDVLARGLSVRETEALAKRHATPPARRTVSPPRPDVHTRAAEEQLKLALGTKVSIVRQGAGGHLEIAFGDEKELQRLYERLTSAAP